MSFTLPPGFNRLLRPSVEWPESLRQLDLGPDYDQPLIVGSLPPTLTSLRLPNYSHPIQPAVLPNLTVLILGPRFNQPIEPGLLPPSLRTLRLGRSFNQPLRKGCLPRRLTRLEIGDSFDSEIYLPPFLEYLSLGDSFSKPYREPLPALTDLRLGRGFDGAVDRALWPHLTRLEIAGRVTQFDCLDRLETLEFTGRCRVRLPKLPRLRSLRLPTDYRFSLPPLPETLERLDLGPTFNKPISHLPEGLVELRAVGFDQQFEARGWFVGEWSWPRLQRLSLLGPFNQPLLELPETLSELELGEEFNQPLSPLPPFLTRLRLGRSFNHPFNSWPRSLRHLELPVDYDHPIPSLPDLDYFRLPIAITEVVAESIAELDLTFVEELLSRWPPGVTKIKLPFKLNREIDPDELPEGVTSIEYGFRYNQPVTELPDSARHLIFGRFFRVSLAQLPASVESVELPIQYPGRDRLPKSVEITYRNGRTGSKRPPMNSSRTSTN